MSEIDRAEALEPVRMIRDRSLAVLGILIVLIVGVAFWFARSLTRPIQDLQVVAGELSEGRLDRPVVVRGPEEILDLARSFESMRESLHDVVQQQEREIEALSVPLIPLSDSVMAMPLVGELDSRRLLKIRKTLVEGLHAAGARVVLLDLTGVPLLHEDSAEELLRAARAVRLLGVRVILTGMRPTVASGLADLVVRLDGIETARSLEVGITRAHEAPPTNSDTVRNNDEERTA